MSNSHSALHQLKDKFLETWPLGRVREMTLEEYTNLNKEDSFTYWIEFRTQELGGIGGGPAFKFGIYERKNTESDLSLDRYKTDGQYAWYARLGDSAVEAFAEVKQNVLDIIEAVQNNQLKKIDDITFGTAVKWKIAFLYSEYTVLNFFKKEGLEYLAKKLGLKQTKNLSFSELNQWVLNQKLADQDYYAFAHELWDIWDSRINEEDESDEDVSFEETVSVFSKKDLNLYFYYLKKFIKELGLEKGDKRFVLTSNRDRLNFVIGQRYSWNLFLKYKKGKFGFISHDPIFEHSEMYSGRPPQPYYTYVNDFDPTQEHLSSIKSGMKHELDRTNKSGYLKHHNTQFEDYIFSEQSNIKLPSMSSHSINTILYGPPGTGKTFSTIDMAAKIVDPENYNPIDHNSNKHIFNQWVKSGKIVFTTFHQSMSYEDFIEGIKPKSDEETGEVQYVIEDGLFKRLSVEASTPYLEKAKGIERQDNLSFTLRFDKLTEEVEEHLEDSEFYPIASKSGSELHIIGISSQGNFIVKHKNGDREYPVSKARLEKLYDAYPQLDVINNITRAFRVVIGGSNTSTYWGILNKLHSLHSDEQSIDWKEVNYEIKAKEFSKINWTEYMDFEAEPYVLIIDEINRGNVSAIFGELITLLEPDKRGGNEEHMIAKLPYSKANFTVPKNLYIIGTMNTADRSVEALDTALRRRFSFEEMMPKPEIIAKELGPKNVWESIRIDAILKTINQRIELLVDRDHLIGHSYFLTLKEKEGNAFKEALIHIFTDKIIPLLQEYFYNDYIKIGMILGEGFISMDSQNTARFANFPETLATEYEERPIFNIKTAEELAQGDQLLQALKLLMNHKTDSDEG